MRHGLRAVHQHRDAAAVRHRDRSRATGLTVPSAFETWVTATIFVRGPSSFSNSSSSSSPRSSMGATRSVRALFFAEHLPGHDVGVVLHGGDQHFVARADVRGRRSAPPG